MKLQSTYANLDVMHGRKQLAKHFAKGGAPIPVIIRAQITGPYGCDDGTSIEFICDVQSVELKGDANGE